MIPWYSDTLMCVCACLLFYMPEKGFSKMVGWLLTRITCFKHNSLALYKYIYIYCWGFARIYSNLTLWHEKKKAMRVSKYHIYLAQHRLGFAHLAVISMVVSVFLCLPSVCSVASYIRYLTHWLLCRTLFILITFLNMALLRKPWFTHMLWFQFQPWFEQYWWFCVKPSFPQRAVLHKNRGHTQTQCFTQKQCSCWACARAVCGLQGSSFHGGRRNTPKAVEYIYKYLYLLHT